MIIFFILMTILFIVLSIAPMLAIDAEEDGLVILPE
jgi:hypothetical protein